jgi:hypothetical protein
MVFVSAEVNPPNNTNARVGSTFCGSVNVFDVALAAIVIANVCGAFASNPRNLRISARLPVWWYIRRPG